MTSTNLALVFGSALLKKGKFGKRESRKTKLGIDHYVASVNVVRAMIDNWDVLFQAGGIFGYTYFTPSSSIYKARENCMWVTKAGCHKISHSRNSSHIR
jgi:hypothetical protein